MLTATGREEEGVTLVPEVLSSGWLPTLLHPEPVELTCRFLIYAHGPAVSRAEALARIKALMSKGGRNQGPSPLSRNAEAAAQAGHPAPGLLYALADIVGWRESSQTPANAITSLEQHPAWAALPGL